MNDRVLLGVVVSMFVLLCASYVSWAHADQRGDRYQGQVDSLQLQIIRGCTAHPDGSGECKPGVLAVPGQRLVAAP